MKNDQAFFEGFSWPLPEAFASAVNGCRFELGDVLYRDARAYDVWSGEVADGLQPIQVLDPPRSARGTPLDGDSDRRRANWASEVRIALIDPRSGESVERVLTQGKLLMALWHGDEAWLDSERDPPSFPRTARDLQANLEASSAAWATEIAGSGARPGSLFVMILDLASDASRAKASLVAERLHASGEVRLADRSPSEAGLEGADLYHPTLVLRGFILPGRDVESVESELRECLYRGGSAAASTPGGEPDESKTGSRFSIARHGLLVAY